MENWSLLESRRIKMMKVNLDNYIEHYKQIIDEACIRHINQLSIPTTLKDAMIYSLEAGGKRIRPLLLFASFQAYDEDISKVLTTATALEMIHTYSLIHDDLPAMDDDDLRRGKPTNHKVFDEATAILAGDALLTYSFELIASDRLLTDTEKVQVIKLLSQASGPSGMVAGQILDMASENKFVNLTTLEKIHELKTGQLLTFAIQTGGYLGKASKQDLEYLTTFSYYLGLIFQVQDDILDVTGDPEQIGKPIGSDADNQKSTYPQLLGLDGAKVQKEKYEEKAKEVLSKTSIEHPYLFALTDYLIQRNH